MALLKLAQVGCGGMGLRHAYGLIELQNNDFDTFELTAICDIQKSAAEKVASEIEAGCGKKPTIYADFSNLLEEENPDAVDIVTDTRFHHIYAIQALENGANVTVEKPMALTVRACKKMINAANEASKVLSVAENYRRDPINRLARAILNEQSLGAPRLAVDIALAGSRTFGHKGSWRHQKNRGGNLVLEQGVHNADLLLYFMGNPETIYAQTRLWEKIRYAAKTPSTTDEFYHHRVNEDIDNADSIECTSEDMAVAMLQFTSGALGLFSMSTSTPGEKTKTGLIYCEDGSIKPSGSRTGNPIQLTKLNGETFSDNKLLQFAPEFALDELTSTFFNGRNTLTSYSMDFPTIDRKLIAIELQDFGDAILSNKDPEVTGEIGLNAAALSYAILESGFIGKPVSFMDVVNDRVNGYQESINKSIGL